MDEQVHGVIAERLGRGKTGGPTYGSDFLGLFMEAYAKKNEEPSPQELR
jgi:hypothetical protein